LRSLPKARLEGDACPSEDEPLAHLFRNLGPTLSLLMRIGGKSRDDLADEAGFGPAQLSLYESGHQLPTMKTLGRLLRTLKIKPATFFFTMDLVDGVEAGLSLGKTDLATVLRRRQGAAGALADELFRQVMVDLKRLHRAGRRRRKQGEAGRGE
jgi:transcriptional regulator with XRE-family HTH domain